MKRYGLQGTVALPSRRLKHLVELKTERASESADGGFVGLENLESWTGRLLKGTFISEDDSNDAEVVQGITFKSGDVLFCKLRPYLAKAHLAKQDGRCTSELLVMRPGQNVSGRFLIYSVLSEAFVKAVDSATFGAKMPRADWGIVGSQRLSLPPLAEQERIADYLDAETARMDALVAEKERMLALLEEKRAALVSHAVTRGLDPNAPTKPSGLDWLGDIPAHWQVRRLKHCAVELQTGPFGSQLHAEDYSEQGIPVINPADIVRYNISEAKAARVDPEIAEQLSRHQMLEGDVVFARRGELGRCARVKLSQEGWLCGTGSLRVRLRQDILDPEFLVVLMANGASGILVGKLIEHCLGIG